MIDFILTLDGTYSSDVTVDVSTADGTAIDSSDYTGQTASPVLITAGTTTATVTVTLLDDAVEEPDETFTLNLANAVNATIFTGTGTATITNDDVTPQLSIDSPTAGEGDGFVLFTVTADIANTVDMTVNVSTFGGTRPTPTTTNCSPAP